MTTSEPSPPIRQTVVQWQAHLLSQIRLLAEEHARILDAGWEGFEPLDPHGGAESAWRHHLDALAGEREQIKQTALSAGLPQAWITDAAALGEHHTQPRFDAFTRAESMPWRDEAAQGFFVDMLGLDLWHLDRMAALVAERADRIATGRWSYGSDPIGEKQFAANMDLRYQRVVALTHAAAITETEAGLLWGDSAEPYRREHAVWLENRDELGVVAAWNSYTKPSTELKIPPYVPLDPATGTPIAGAHALPPTPRQMIAAAQASLRAGFIDTAVASDTAEQTVDTVDAASAISAAVDDALGHDGSADWAADPHSDSDPESVDGRNHPDVGKDP
ncbi:hypothetical protein OG225_06225 [Nocardia sp. NBC_01377]|uniref:hypothetical protein n=1 Tax=Nocardia sp. NBC_01377 TaxID=2903595 RepID=UPI00324DF468